MSWYNKRVIKCSSEYVTSSNSSKQTVYQNGIGTEGEYSYSYQYSSQQGHPASSSIVTTTTTTNYNEIPNQKFFNNSYLPMQTQNYSPVITKIQQPAITEIKQNEKTAHCTEFKDASFSQLEIDALNEHNRLRSVHGCPPLTLNRQLCEYARQWAETIAKKNVMQHRSNGKYGENIYMSSGLKVDGKSVTKTWYDEIKDFRFGSTQFNAQTGHFTQVVWKNSKDMGIGMATNRNGYSYVVANYDPPGNYMNQFNENVPRPLKT